MRVDRPLAGAVNMARDHAFAGTLPSGHARLRLYRWRRPTISFGRNEPARGLYDVGAARRAGVDFVRRPTGGRAVLHDRELTYAVAVPAGRLGGPRDAYRRVNEALLGALWSLGLPASPWRGEGRAARPDAGPCFGAPVSGELVVGRRKILGSAQARIGRVLLQHGSLPLASSRLRLEELRVRDEAADGEAVVGGRARPATVEEVLGFVPSWEMVVDAVIGGFRAEVGGHWEHGSAGDGAADPEVEQRLTKQYGDGRWTWRR